MNKDIEEKSDFLETALDSVNKAQTSLKYFTSSYPQLIQTQINFLAAYVQNDFHIGKACMACNIGRYTFNDWQRNDKIFHGAFNDTKQILIDSAEACIKKSIELMDTKSAQFILKTIGKDRGYKESIDITSNDETIIPNAVINILNIKNDSDE